MGFRFRTSVKLAPGLRLNFSKSGVSTSVGVRGARVNFSKRGIYQTIGIPGTGMYWTQRLDGGGRAVRQRPRTMQRPISEKPLSSVQSLDELDAIVADPNAVLVHSESGRRMSSRQVEAARRKMEQEQRRQQSLAKAEAAEQRLQEVIDWWREMPLIPSISFYQDACQVRPFEFDEPPPPKPDGPSEVARLRDEVARVLRREVPPALSLRLCAIAGGAVVGFVAGMLSAVAFGPGGWAFDVLLGAAAVALGLWLIQKNWQSEMRDKIGDATHERWPARVAELKETYRVLYRAYAERHNRAATSWNTSERERVSWVRQLLEGDMATVEASICDSLSDLNFPFETECRVATSDGGRVHLHLDLPEIEDVVPETKDRVLKDGSVTSVKRNAKERAKEYAVLVTGLGVLLARMAFAAAPSLSCVHIAAYTQRRKGMAEAVDDYVYDAVLSRAAVNGVDPASMDPIQFLADSRARMDLRNSMELKGIEPPEWVKELMADSSE